MNEIDEPGEERTIGFCPECGALVWEDCICDDDDDYWYDDEY